MTTTYAKPKLTIKAQTLYTLGAIIAGVALPQLFHIVGALSGTGSALGETFLPMHLPIILVGLLAGPYAGMIAGLSAPVISFLLTGMPSSVLLPFMVIELAVYGLTAGIMRNIKMPVFFKVLISQIAGRAIRAGVILLSVYAFSNNLVPVQIIWKSILTGLFGIILQWTFIPLLIYRVENK